MATYNFIVYAPYHTDDRIHERRAKWRPSHVERLLGISALSGILVSEDTYKLPDAEKKFIGSTMILETGSLEEARKIIEDDPYYKNDVWDKEKIIITPFYVPPNLVKHPNTQ